MAWNLVKPYSGTLNIRISPEIHSRIAALAQEAGTTINRYIKRALEESVEACPLKNKGIDRFRRDSTWFHAFSHISLAMKKNIAINRYELSFLHIYIGIAHPYRPTYLCNVKRM